MKALLLILILLLSETILAQTIHRDSTNGYAYVNITPVWLSINDTTYTTKIYAWCIKDDFLSRADFYWELRSNNGYATDRGNFSISDTSYVAYKADTSKIAFFKRYKWANTFVNIIN